jgi:hypothetical protein
MMGQAIPQQQQPSGLGFAQLFGSGLQGLLGTYGIPGFQPGQPETLESLAPVAGGFASQFGSPAMQKLQGILKRGKQPRGQTFPQYFRGGRYG